MDISSALRELEDLLHYWEEKCTLLELDLDEAHQRLKAIRELVRYLRSLSPEQEPKDDSSGSEGSVVSSSLWVDAALRAMEPGGARRRAARGSILAESHRSARAGRRRDHAGGVGDVAAFIRSWTEKRGGLAPVREMAADLYATGLYPGKDMKFYIARLRATLAAMKDFRLVARNTYMRVPDTSQEAEDRPKQ